VICTVTMDRSQLLAELADIKAKTKSSVELSTRLIDQSFLRFKASHRNLYAVRRSQELLDALLKGLDSGVVCRELSGSAGGTKERPITFHSGITAEDMRCDRCDSILVNNKAYWVRTEDRGLALLDMLVCYACNLEAQNLGLQTDEVKKSSVAEHRIQVIESMLDTEL